MSDYKAPTVGQAPGQEIRVSSPPSKPLWKINLLKEPRAGCRYGRKSGDSTDRGAVGWPSSNPQQGPATSQQAGQRGSSLNQLWCCHGASSHGRRKRRARPSQKVRGEGALQMPHAGGVSLSQLSLQKLLPKGPSCTVAQQPLCRGSQGTTLEEGGQRVPCPAGDPRGGAAKVAQAQ